MLTTALISANGWTADCGDNCSSIHNCSDLLATNEPAFRKTQFVQLPLSDALSNWSGRPGIHRPITDRSHDLVSALFEKLNHLKPSDAPSFDLQRIYDGASVLSLGEGRSDFIATVLGRQPEGMKNAYAVDAQVLNAPSGFEDHYIRAPYQDLNLVNSETGQQAQFDFMFSLFSLHFVVTKGRGISTDLVKILEVLKRHLKHGGILVIIPGIHDSTFGEVAEHPGLKIWQGRADLSGYGLPERYTIIQRTD